MSPEEFIRNYNACIKQLDKLGLKMNQSQVASIAGISRQALSGALKNKAKLSVTTMEKIIEYLRDTINDRIKTLESKEKEPLTNMSDEIPPYTASELLEREFYDVDFEDIDEPDEYEDAYVVEPVFDVEPLSKYNREAQMFLSKNIEVFLRMEDADYTVIERFKALSPETAKLFISKLESMLHYNKELLSYTGTSHRSGGFIAVDPIYYYSAPNSHRIGVYLVKKKDFILESLRRKYEAPAVSVLSEPSDFDNTIIQDKIQKEYSAISSELKTYRHILSDEQPCSIPAITERLPKSHEQFWSRVDNLLLFTNSDDLYVLYLMTMLAIQDLIESKGNNPKKISDTYMGGLNEYLAWVTLIGLEGQ